MAVLTPKSGIPILLQHMAEKPEVIVWKSIKLFSWRAKTWFFLQSEEIFDLLYVFRLNTFTSKTWNLLLPFGAEGFRSCVNPDILPSNHLTNDKWYHNPIWPINPQ